MPHQRIRHALPLLKKLSKLWPAVGILGARQVGKSTLLQSQLSIEYYISLDEEDVLSDALRSAKLFLQKLQKPAIIDEIQKAPALFDALKSAIDRKKIPGQFYVTGSSRFSSRLGVRESLTGRIGLLELKPFTLAEKQEKDLLAFNSWKKFEATRFKSELIMRNAPLGGVPVPTFLRDPLQRNLYWKSWLETTVYRDIARFFKRAYDPLLVFQILKQFKIAALNNELVTRDYFKSIQRQKLQRYLQAMEDVFLLRRIPCHEKGIGQDSWLLFDSGLLCYLLGDLHEEGNVASMVRTYLCNEILSHYEYHAERADLTFFKSQKGLPVDFVINEVPVKLVTDPGLKSLGWQQRALEGAMKTLKAPLGILLAPVDTFDVPKNKKGIAVVPWTIWS